VVGGAGGKGRGEEERGGIGDGGLKVEELGGRWGGRGRGGWGERVERVDVKKVGEGGGVGVVWGETKGGKRKREVKLVERKRGGIAGKEGWNGGRGD